MTRTSSNANKGRIILAFAALGMVAAIVMQPLWTKLWSSTPVLEASRSIQLHSACDAA
jgi:hypothetical protein